MAILFYYFRNPSDINERRNRPIWIFPIDGIPEKKDTAAQTQRSRPEQGMEDDTSTSSRMK